MRSCRRRSWTSIWDQAFSVLTRSRTRRLNVKTPYRRIRATIPTRIHRATTPAILSAGAPPPGDREPRPDRLLNPDRRRVPVRGLDLIGHRIPPVTLGPGRTGLP